MTRFAFILHPIKVADIARKFGIARYLPHRLIEAACARMPARLISEISGIESPTGATTEGWFVGCTLTTRQFIEGNEERSVAKVIEAAKMAQDLGADIVGLGAFTAVVGDGGRRVADAVDIAVTTGNSYTVATAIEGTLKAAEVMEINPGEATAAVVGATGSIGRICAHLLADRVPRIILIGRSRDGLDELAEELADRDTEVEVSLSPEESIPQADLVVTVTSALDTVIEPEMLRPGAVVCDVARPRDVSVRVAHERDDVLVIEGGAVAIPGDVDFHFDFGFPPGTAYACMAETMILALEGRAEDFSLGKRLSIERVREIADLGVKHGFGLAGFRSFERAVDDETIKRIKRNAAAR
ncbi:MAG: shikimate dehydrogenase [candidate division WS1 bacterium]|nr:shikimate dehydrogenase [candidate division WS1 bacterium]